MRERERKGCSQAELELNFFSAVVRLLPSLSLKIHLEKEVEAIQLPGISGLEGRRGI